jgi:Ca2+-binding RTX toxin-like protein
VLIDAAFMGNFLVFLLAAAVQIGGFDDLFDEDEPDPVPDPVPEPPATPEPGYDPAFNPTYDPALYGQELLGTADADLITPPTSDPASAIFGMGGADLISATQSADYVDGGAGDDFLVLFEGDDIALGGDGNDEIAAGRGDDTVLGGAGDDAVDGSLGNDLIYGGDGDDQLEGARDNDVIYGGAGNDVISGDRLDGIGGVDRGIDTLYGEDGDDTLWLYGEDTGTGGAGADLFRVINADSPDTGVTITDYNASEDMIQVHYADDSGGPPSLSIASIDGTDDVQILLEAQVVAIITDGMGLTASDVVLTATL